MFSRVKIRAIYTKQKKIKTGRSEPEMEKTESAKNACPAKRIIKTV